MRKIFANLTLLISMSIISSCNNTGAVSGENILLTDWSATYDTPPLDKIAPGDFIPAFEAAMAERMALIDSIAMSESSPTFKNTILPYDSSGARLMDIYYLFSLAYYGGVNPAYKSLNGEVMAMMSSHNDAILQNMELFARIKSVHDALPRLRLNEDQKQLVEYYYDDFVRGGAELSEEQKQRITEINVELAQLSARFGENLLGEEQRLYMSIPLKDAEGLIFTVRNAAKAAAKERGESGREVYTTHPVSWQPFLTASPRRDLRDTLYNMYLNRSRIGGEFDNLELVRQISLLRLERSKIMGFESFAASALSDQMAASPAEAYKLLNKAWPLALEQAAEEQCELAKMLKKELGDSTEFASWDWLYYGDKLRKERYDLNIEIVRPYFSLDAVRSGAFLLANRLYGITFRPIIVPQFASDFTAYEVLDVDNSQLGVLYIDPYQRSDKNQGAWCEFIREQRYEDGKRITPIVSISCNFAKGEGSTPSLLNPTEVRTLFHEFGHALNFLFMDVQYRGMLRYQNDFVEFPSQFMENYAFEPQVLKSYAIHYRTGAVISDDLIKKLNGGSKFMKGYESAEYLASSLIDLDLSSIASEEQLEAMDIEAFEHEQLRVKRKLSSAIEPRYHYSYFRHMFTYDYAARYYSYIWSEVLDKDAYSRFKLSGDIFNRKLATKLREEVLARGGARTGMELYYNFCGEEPNADYMLFARGLIDTVVVEPKSEKTIKKEIKMRENPLLTAWDNRFDAPPFEQIRLSDYEPAFDEAIAASREEIKAIVENPAAPTFENTIVALERQGELLDRVAGVFYPLHSADTSDEMEEISLRVQPKLTQLSNDISLNEQLFERVKSVYNNPPEGLSVEDKTLLEECYKGFTRSGADLSEADKKLYRSYTEELGRLSIEFGQNALNATNDFTINITDESVVSDLPEMVREALSEEAASREQQGWTVTLQAPSYIPFLTYSSSRPTKEKLWRAYSSRALGGKYDNSKIITRMVELRRLIAELLGYDSYAAYALDNRMAESAEVVNEFLAELLDKTKEYAVKDYQNVVDFAHESGFEGEFMPWDFPYYAERLKDDSYSISDELVKPYFELESVRKGAFMLATKLYGITFRPVHDVELYHPEVSAYEVLDGDGSHLALLYLDFFPRSSKRGGAWMTEFRGSWVDGDGESVRPLVTLVMNFTKPTESTPSLLTFSEVETLLHEFGHALHGILAKGTYGSQSGTNVYRDFVELPSQMLENWASEPEFLELWAKHYKTGEKIPADIIEKIVKAKNYNAAYAHVRQLQFGLLDMAWHTLDAPYEGDIEAFEAEATAATRILPAVEGAAISPAFSHIFNGGYSAGYYSYKWAEVLEADAYERFLEEGIFNREVAQSFRDNILSKGGQEHPMTLYVRYRGHAPQPQALIDKILK